MNLWRSKGLPSFNSIFLYPIVSAMRGPGPGVERSIEIESGVFQFEVHLFL